MADPKQILTGNVRTGPYHEDVLDELYEITDVTTPFSNMIGDTSANSVYTDWGRRALSVRDATNAHQEGVFYTSASYVNATLASRSSNWQQTFKRLPFVSGEQEAMDPVGISNLMADAVDFHQAGFKTDIEHALLRGSINSGPTTVTATETTARRLGGLHNVMTYTTLHTTNTTFSETRWNDFSENGWSRGAMLRDVLVGGRLKRGVSAFTASSTKYIFSEDKQIVNAVDMYENDFYVQTIHLSQDVPNVQTTAPRYCAYLFDRDFFQKAWLRRPRRRELPITADGRAMEILGQCTLKYGHPAAGTIVTGFHYVPV